MSDVAFRPFALWLSAGFVAALTGVVAHSYAARTNRHTLENSAQLTAVEDTHLYDPAKGQPLTLHGHKLAPLDKSPEEVRETRMLQTGSEDSGLFTLYTLHEATHSSGEGIYFLKTGENHFLRFQAEKKQ